MPNTPRRTLLLTGASRGIGHATVKRFSSAGWRVITCSRHPFPEECPWEAGPEDHIQVDLADPHNTSVGIAEIKRRLEHGHLHALVNNAAISPKADGGSRLGSIETTLDVWSQVFRVNFFAPVMLARGLIEELKAAKGSVVNVTSKDRRADSAASARHAGRGREDHLRAVHRDFLVCERGRDSYQRRPARVIRWHLSAARRKAPGWCVGRGKNLGATVARPEAARPEAMPLQAK